MLRFGGIEPISIRIVIQELATTLKYRFSKFFISKLECDFLIWSTLAFLLPMAIVQSTWAQSEQIAPNEPTRESQIDFQRDVSPIFRTHCLECHNEAKADGDLRLDSKEAALLGGHTGNPILGSLENSELLERINSPEDGYRMPKKGDPLTNQQIATLTQWIEEGAPWPVSSNANMDRQRPEPEFSVIGWLADKYLLLEHPEYRYPAIVLAAGATLLFLLCLNGFLRKRERRKLPSLSNENRKRPWIIPGVAVLTGLLAIIAFQHGKIETLARGEGLAANSNSNGIESNLPSNASNDLPTAPEVPKPMHPPRLGGVYYRGNDERNSELFNGGFYRTAELEIQLIGKGESKIEYGEEISPGELAIEFQMRRAKGATKALFSKRTLQTAYLSTHHNRLLTVRDRQMIKPVELDESWQAVFPLNLKEGSESENHQGTIYVFYGPLDHNRIHYAINYSIDLKDGVVLPTSEVWMGSVYNLSGRVVVPSEDQIGLHHWFDFRPIPEIDGKNSENPELLGLPEHLDSNVNSTPLDQQ